MVLGQERSLNLVSFQSKFIFMWIKEGEGRGIKMSGSNYDEQGNL